MRLGSKPHRIYRRGAIAYGWSVSRQLQGLPARLIRHAGLPAAPCPISRKGRAACQNFDRGCKVNANCPHIGMTVLFHWLHGMFCHPSRFTTSPASKLPSQILRDTPFQLHDPFMLIFRNFYYVHYASI
jgi:hypothetical protein